MAIEFLGLIISDFVVNIIVGIVGSAIFALLVILVKPVFKGLLWIRRKLWMWWKNPEVDVDVSLAGYFRSEDHEQVMSKIQKALDRSVSSNIVRKDTIISFRNKTSDGTMDVRLLVAMDPDAVGQSKFLTIDVRMGAVRVKSLEKILVGIQSFIFKDLITALNRSILIDPDVETQAIRFDLHQTPRTLKPLKSINVSSIKGKEEGINYEIKERHIRATGVFDPTKYGKLEAVVKENLNPNL